MNSPAETMGLNTSEILSRVSDLRTVSRLLILGLIFIVALVAESIWPLRQKTQPKAMRLARNLGLATISMIFVRFAFLPFEIWAANLVTQKRLGILNLISFNSVIKISVSFLLLEYTFYVWHYLNHRLPFLWRFHNVHHVDLDLDVSTASRFHFGELAFSSLFRVGQIFLIGIDVPTLLLFETCITAFAQFHHSNLRLPKRVDSLLATLIMTPELHGIHHSIVRNETDSNYGTIFTFWDRAHRTLKRFIPQNEIVIGVPSYMLTMEQVFANILLMPFQHQRDWKLPTGEIPSRIERKSK